MRTLSAGGLNLTANLEVKDFLSLELFGYCGHNLLVFIKEFTIPLTWLLLVVTPGWL